MADGMNDFLNTFFLVSGTFRCVSDGKLDSEDG